MLQTMPKNNFPAWMPAIKLPDLQLPDLEFLQSADGSVPHGATAKPRDAQGAAKSAPMNPLQKHAAASEQFFKDNPGWGETPIAPAAIMSDAERACEAFMALRGMPAPQASREAVHLANREAAKRASADNIAKQSFFEWVTGSQDRAAQGGKLALLTVGRTKFDAWVMPDAGALYVRPVTCAAVDAIALLDRGRASELPEATIDGQRIHVVGVHPCDPMSSPNGCNVLIRYKLVAEKNEPKTPPDAREHKLTILGETFDAVNGLRHGEFVVTIRDDTRRRAYQIIADLKKNVTAADVDGRSFVFVGLDRSGSMREERVTFRLEPTVFVREWQCEFVGETAPETKTEAEQHSCTQCGSEIPRGYMVRAADDAPCCSTDCVQVRNRLAREAPLVALVNNVPEGLDPVGWRAAVLAVDEAHIMSSKARVRWDYERLSEWLPTVLEKGMDECDAGAPYADGLAAYRRAVAPHKAPTRQPRSWRDVGPRLTVDIDDGRDE